MKKTLFFFAFLSIFLSGIAQQDTTFNKLLYPVPGTTGIFSIKELNSNYYLLFLNIDTPNISVTTYGIMIMDSLFNITDTSIIHPNKYISSNIGHNFDVNPNDTSFIFAGTVRYAPNKENGYLVKFDKNLDTLWTLQIAHPDTAYADTAATPWVALRDVKVTPLGNYIVVGNYNYHCQGGRNRSFIIKMDSGGGIIWYRLLDHSIYTSRIVALEVDKSDSGFFFVSRKASSLNLIKADKNGTIQWDTPFNSEPSFSDYLGFKINNNEVLIGSNYLIPPVVNGSFAHLHLVSINKQTHTINWSKKFYSISVKSKWLRAETIDIEITPSGNIAVGTVGVKYENNHFTADHRAIILMLNSNGDSLWSRYYTYNDNSMGAEDMQFNDMVVCPDGGLLFGGDRAHNALFLDAWLVKTDSMGYCPYAYTVSIEQDELIIAKNKLSLYPNPATNNINLGFEQSPTEAMQLSIYNTAGQLVLSKRLNGYGDTYRVNIEALALGVYFVHLSSETGEVFRSKFVKR